MRQPQRFAAARNGERSDLTRCHQHADVSNKAADEAARFFSGQKHAHDVELPGVVKPPCRQGRNPFL